MFNAAQALLALKELDSKKHSGVISLFNQHFVKTGIIDRMAGRDLNKARVRRESSYYADFYLVSTRSIFCPAMVINWGAPEPTRRLYSAGVPGASQFYSAPDFRVSSASSKIQCCGLTQTSSPSKGLAVPKYRQSFWDRNSIRTP